MRSEIKLKLLSLSYESTSDEIKKRKTLWKKDKLRVRQRF